MSNFRTPGHRRSASAALLGMTVAVATLFSTASTSHAEEERPRKYAPGVTDVTDVSIRDVAVVTSSTTGNTTKVGESVGARKSGTDHGSGGWWALIENGCRTVKVTNKKWNYTHTQVLAKFNPYALVLGPLQQADPQCEHQL